MEYMRLGMSWVSLRTLVYSGHNMDEWDCGIGTVRTYIYTFPDDPFPFPFPPFFLSCCSVGTTCAACK